MTDYDLCVNVPEAGTEAGGTECELVDQISKCVDDVPGNFMTSCFSQIFHQELFSAFVMFVCDSVFVISVHGQKLKRT